MATKTFKEIKSLSKDELVSKARELEKEIFQARMQKATGQLANTAKIWRLRKDLARVKTLETQGAAKGSG